MTLLVKPNPDSCGLLRRLGVMAYDILLLAGLLLFAILLFLAITGQLGNIEEGVPMEVRSPALRIGLQAYLLAIVMVFYVGFWCTSGRTLGLQTWKLRVETMQGERLSVGQGVLRFVVALIALLPFGLGFFWMYSNPERRGWHDLASNSRVVKTKLRLS